MSVGYQTLKDSLDVQSSLKASSLLKHGMVVYNETLWERCNKYITKDLDLKYVTMSVCSDEFY